jgi:predicted PurR-regulated permease PerM
MSADGSTGSAGSASVPGTGHNDLVGQPHTGAEGKVAEAEVVAARISTEDAPRGPLGPRFNWRSPFAIGMTATGGAALTVGLIVVVLQVGSVLILIGVALFLAVGMEPAVSWLVRHHIPRWAAVITVLLVITAGVAAFVAAAGAALVTQGEQLANQVPTYLQQAQDHQSFIGHLNDQFQIQAKLQTFLDSSGADLATGILGAGQVVFGVLADSLVVAVLTIYFLADLPRIRALLYRFVPHARRPRAILIGDDILAKIGGYVLGNVVISVITAVLTFIWLLSFGVPYAFLLSVLVALLDLVPVVGSTVAGIIVALVALTVSLPVCLLTVGFFVVYRFFEDYVLVPKLIGRAVEVPALVTVVAVLIGAALLGVVGALVAIPAAAALVLLANEIWFPRLDQGQPPAHTNPANDRQHRTRIFRRRRRPAAAP